MICVGSRTQKFEKKINFVDNPTSLTSGAHQGTFLNAGSKFFKKPQQKNYNPLYANEL